LAVADLNATRKFYLDQLGLTAGSAPHVFQVTSSFEIHACVIDPIEPIPAGWPKQMASLSISSDSWAQRINHVALRVTSIQGIVRKLTAGGVAVFQMDSDGNRVDIMNQTQPLNFGLRTAYCYDPSGNLIELIDDQSIIES
jgi:catechol 2,3-dioxygenase-like lactoylglutathione lyase family enzyme